MQLKVALDKKKKMSVFFFKLASLCCSFVLALHKMQVNFTEPTSHQQPSTAMSSNKG